MTRAFICSTGEAISTARWYSSWILIFAFLPVLAMYVVWIPLTVTGRLKPVRKLKKNWKPRTYLSDYGALVGSQLHEDEDNYEGVNGYADPDNLRLQVSDDDHFNDGRLDVNKSMSYNWMQDEEESDEDQIISV
jgi:hypothetical protein